MIITLVITMVLAGHDVERREQIKSLPECWDRAKAVMEHILDPSRNPEGFSKGQGSEVTTVGVGCVVETGKSL